MSVLDLRSRQTPSGPPKAGKLHKGALVMRDPSTIDTICLHQTATLLPPGKADLRAANGDPALARHLRALRVHAHVTAFTTGTAVIAYPLRAYVWHGNGANASSIGVECEASLTGLDTSCDEKVVEAGRAALTWLCENGPTEGIHISYIVAHRQSSKTRRGDPGLALWRAVALDHGVAKLGLRTTPERVWGDGRPIPVEWQADGVGNY
jgi:hypothetical protein